MGVVTKMTAYELLFHLRRFDQLWLDSFVLLVLALLTEDYELIFCKAGDNLDAVRGLQSKCDFLSLELIAAIHHEHGTVALSCRLNGLYRKRENVSRRTQRQLHGRVHARHEFEFRVRNVYFGVHRPRAGIDLVREAHDLAGECL